MIHECMYNKNLIKMFYINNMYNNEKICFLLQEPFNFSNNYTYTHSKTFSFYIYTNI